MMEQDTAWSDEERLQITRVLDGILASPVFSSAERQRRLLRFLVERALAGEGGRLNQYTLGIDVFDRDESFDPAIDSIVRVEVARLRSKLRDYYDEHGRTDPIRFELPKGTYGVVVQLTESNDGGSADTGLAVAGSVATKTTAEDPAPDKPSIAILPFENISGDPEQSYFADGITEDLITDLSKLSGLFVIARHSSFVYKDVNKKADQIADELGVRYLVEGSVRRGGDKLRISAQLIDGRTGSHLWAERYDRGMDDIFAVQDEVNHRIIEALDIRLSWLERERRGYRGTDSLQAYDLLLRGQEPFWTYTKDNVHLARSLFERVIEIDPSFADAHAWLARAVLFQWIAFWTESDDELERALGYARRAVQLDALLPYAHAILGWTQMWRGVGDEAVTEGELAVRLNPNDAYAHLWLSVIYSSVARGAEALANAEQAMRLNPHATPFQYMMLGNAYYVLERYDDAVTAYERGIERNPDFYPNHMFLASLAGSLGRDKEARRERQALRKLVPNFTAGQRVFFIDQGLEQRLLEGFAKAGV
jgi:adenylate cyclase